jgi:hypothetical protein
MNMWRMLLLAVIGVVLLAYGNLTRRPVLTPESAMDVVVSIPLQLLAAGGDRYLAANVGTWRSIMVGTNKLPRETLRVLAAVQEDASWLNPAHEDNYYMATAILPWEGEVTSTQVILRRATDSRLQDPYPPFYLGFNQLHFLGDSKGAAKIIMDAAARINDPQMKQALTIMGAFWVERGDDTDLAIKMVDGLMKSTRDRAMKSYLQQRIQRLEGLKLLQAATQRYEKDTGHAPKSIAELQGKAYVAEIPVDPLGGGYALSNGRVVLLPAKE